MSRSASQWLDIQCRILLCVVFYIEVTMNINISDYEEETSATTENTLLDDRYTQDMLTLVICCLCARTYFSS